VPPGVYHDGVDACEDARNARRRATFMVEDEFSNGFSRVSNGFSTFPTGFRGPSDGPSGVNINNTGTIAIGASLRCAPEPSGVTQNGCKVCSTGYGAILNFLEALRLLCPRVHAPLAGLA